MRTTPSRVVPLAAAAIAIATLSGCTYASQATGTSQSLGGASASAVSTSVPTEKIPAVPLDPAAAALLPTDIASSGTLTVGTDPTFPPFELYASNNKTVVGLDADLATAIGQTLGVTVSMVPATFDTILPGIASKKYDLGISGFSVTPERQANADFVVYHESGSALAVPPGNPEKLSMDPLTLCGRTIGGEKGSTQGLQILPEFSKKCTDAGKKPITVQLFPTQSDANLAIVSGRVQAVMSGSTSMGYQAKLSGGAFQLAGGGDYEPKPTGIALPKGSSLTPAIAAAVKKIVETPAYAAIFAKWGVSRTDAVTADQVFPG